jgi:hypothetical protein
MVKTESRSPSKMKQIQKIVSVLISTSWRALLLATVILGSIGASLFAAAAQAAGTATLSMTPASGAYSIGQTISISVYTNTGSDPVNAVEADFSYPVSRLQYESIDASDSAFSIGAPSAGGKGKVTIARGTIQPVTGHELVAIVHFKATATGSAALKFLSSSAVVSSTNNTNLLGITAGASYTLSKPAHNLHYQNLLH